MSRSPRVPATLRDGPFLQSTAARHGVSPDMLTGRSWKRLHPRVWVHRDHVMTHLDHIHAATLTMPAGAHLSHVSRIQALGLQIGEPAPIHFTVAGDLHISTDGIFLHRTEALPPVDEVGVSPASAFVQMCATARLIDAVVAGDWLVAQQHMTRGEALEIARLHDWRPGAHQAPVALRLLDDRSRSPKESEARVLIEASGLPRVETNADVDHGGQRIAVVDLLMRDWRLALEYEGRQHALDTRQFAIDIKRYAALRQAGYEYVQITQEMLAQPRALMLHIHKILLRRGYDGPAPSFGSRWTALFRTIHVPQHFGR